LFCLLSIALPYWDIIPNHLVAQLVEAAVVMISDVSKRLAKFPADFRERVAFEEVQAQRLSLILGQRLEHLLQAITPKNCLCGIIAFSGRSSDQTILAPLNLHPRIELARLEVAAPLDGPVVNHLDNPGASGTFRAVKDRALPLDE
jgi:hypothetical protein